MYTPYGQENEINNTFDVAVTLAEHTMGLWHWVFYVSLPLSAIKQLISVVQLIAACVNITRQDVVTRKQQRAAKSS